MAGSTATVDTNFQFRPLSAERAIITRLLIIRGMYGHGVLSPFNQP
jgi:hypothetical protein